MLGLCWSIHDIDMPLDFMLQYEIFCCYLGVHLEFDLFDYMLQWIYALIDLEGNSISILYEIYATVAMGIRYGLLEFIIVYTICAPAFRWFLFAYKWGVCWIDWKTCQLLYNFRYALILYYHSLILNTGYACFQLFKSDAMNILYTLSFIPNRYHTWSFVNFWYNPDRNYATYFGPILRMLCWELLCVCPYFQWFDTTGCLQFSIYFECVSIGEVSVYSNLLELVAWVYIMCPYAIDFRLLTLQLEKILWRFSL